MKNNLENPDILSKYILTAIDVILKNVPNAVFGGSIALNAVGLINRPVKDIDLFIPIGSVVPDSIVESSEGIITSETSEDTNGVLIDRTGMLIAGQGVCLFKVPEEELAHSKINVLGRELNIQNVNYALRAKMSYADKTDKHKKDLKEINNILDNL